MKDVSPCITRSRYKGHYISNVQRRMTIEEMCRFQGFNPTKLKHCVSDTELGHMLGNAMSVNIIERILFRVIRHMEFAQLAGTVDRWESGQALRDLHSSKNSKLHRVVCTWNSPGRANHITSAEGTGTQDICAIAGHKVDRVIDSGASFHVMNPKDMTLRQKNEVYKIKPLHIITANGRITINRAADVYVATLGCKLTFLVMEDAPPLISLGLLVRLGFDFTWKGDSCILTRNGKTLECEVRGNVPHLSLVNKEVEEKSVSQDSAPEDASQAKPSTSSSGGSQGNPGSAVPKPAENKDGSSQDCGKEKRNTSTSPQPAQDAQRKESLSRKLWKSEHYSTTSKAGGRFRRLSRVHNE